MSFEKINDSKVTTDCGDAGDEANCGSYECGETITILIVGSSLGSFLSGTYMFEGINNVKPYYRHTTRQILLHSSTSNNYWQLGPNLNGGAYAYRKRSTKLSFGQVHKFEPK